MTFWVKTIDGKNIRLKDSDWRARIYASGAACDDPEFVFSRLKDSGYVSKISVVEKRTSIFDSRKSEALEIELNRADRGKKVADLLEAIFQNPSTFRLYNVDLTAEQQYFLENDLFPLARVAVDVQGEEVTGWKMMDDVRYTDYEIPRLKVLGLDIALADKVSRLDSRLSSVTLTPSIYHAEEILESIQIDGCEKEILIRTAREV